MKTNLYAIYDSKACSFGPPLISEKDGLAARLVSDWASDPNSSFARHPNDFSLYRIGVFDTEAGLFENTSPNVLIGTIASFLAISNPTSEVTK